MNKPINDGILLAQAQSAPQTLFTTQTPGFEWSDGTPYELGMKFRSTKVGNITAIRFWKAASESGIHVGRIWSANGSQLASVTFSNETASGWQQQALSEPLNIEANTTYIVSYTCNSYSAITLGGLASVVVNGFISSVADGNNGVYGQPANSFPTNSYQNSNYFCDVAFVPSSMIVKVSGDSQTGAAGASLPNPLVVQVKDSSGNPQAGVTLNFAITSGGGSVSPLSAITDASGQASTVLTLGTTDGIENTVSATALGIGSITFRAKALPNNPNSIFLENQKPGTTNWQITDYSTTEIAGYAGAPSVNKGGSLPIKVSLGQPGQLKIDVYRLGYYQGQGGRLIVSSGTLNGITQPACSFDSATRLIECNWSTSYTVTVGANWISGLYVAKLTDLATAKQSQVWFVVRDDSSTSNIVFSSCFNTFQAYNNSGGYGLYPWNSINGERSFKVSYDRPFAQTSASSAWLYDSMTRHQRHMVYWLESQSYDVSYITNLDIQNNPQLLRQHKLYLSVGHDEYWSMAERNAVEQARDANPPVNLAFFSANTCYWRVRFENSSANNVPNRIMACYKGATDPVLPTKTFRNTQINRPENALLGVLYTGEDYYGLYDTSSNLYNPSYSGYDFIVTNSSDPYYANTGLGNGSVLPDLVGFEWDAVVNNGFTPSNLVILSSSPVNQPYPLDLEIPQPYPKVSNAVRYTALSGAKVFTTGSIHWMLGLDSSFCGTTQVDWRAKQIAVNVLANMGAKPQTPDANMIVP
ncbi:N,N-dimethylformamidase beta subunit family domain-containing protein [Chlorogloea sp. CCALA 695]|uniref:N,N-dimethylformamidase beta subunit family domain-containing protein n=1 Tax=Chlorogloea sp. CCALA 695 TaxID=2107693 RepID=UPI000D06A329|nr:N,N-dimethylformamidase beta subunit family domain-containing protein [Chlorogloea sp. CCALA 695]PSB29496.1 Ig domain-containing protein group 1 domain-containing protein [Chlorogloea sp. CCALA 695]